jgi:subtilisin
MRRATSLALAALLALGASPLAAVPASAAPAPRFAALPEDSAHATTKLTAEGRYIVTLKGDRDVDVAKGHAARLGVKADRTFRSVLKGYSAHLDATQLAALRADADVESVVPDEIISMTAQTRPTGIRRVNVPENLLARVDGVDGTVADGQRVDADVAIVDTGIDKTHPDLNVVGGISCSTDNPQAWGDPNGHGTHVSGTVGAIDNGSGVVGVAPGVRLWAVRILNSAGDGLVSWYVCGLDWIRSQRDPADPTRPLIESVNMSVAKPGKDDGNCGNTINDAMHKAICRLVSSGVTVVAAAGNDHFNAANLRPASYNEVITVSALADSDGRRGGLGGSLCYSWGGYDQDDTFADFSNYGGDVDLIAPGKCIWSTLPGNRYGYISGTSMAAPLVTGAAALYKASRPLATPAQVKAALRAAGTQDWNTSTDPDSVHEPLLDTSHLVSVGDFTLDATPGTSGGTLGNAAGAVYSVPLSLVRAEDFAGAVTLSIEKGAPFGAALGTGTLTGQGGVATTLGFTIPASTPSGSYPITVRASDGTRERTSTYPITVDADLPGATAPSLHLRNATSLSRSGVPGYATWAVATDVGSGVARYEYRWRVDGVLGVTTKVAAGASRSVSRTLSIAHTYALRVRSVDEAGNTGPWTESAAFKPALVQDTSTLDRHGTWTRYRNSLASGGTTLYSGSRGAWVAKTFTGRGLAVVVTQGPKQGRAQVYVDNVLAATITTLYSGSRGAWVAKTFTGRGLAVVVTQGPKQGRAQVYVDNVLAATIKTHADTRHFQRIVFVRTWATAGSHTVRVVVLREPVSHPRIDLDAFVIVP